MTTIKPTEEQETIICAFNQPRKPNLVIEAGAGAGKSSTLKMLANQNPKRRGLYIAFNKSVQMEAAESFNSSVKCKTSYALAFPSVGRLFAHRLNGARMPSSHVARILGINNPLVLQNENQENREVKPEILARLAIETVQKFCQSDSDSLHWSHVPFVPGLDRDGMNSLRSIILPFAEKAWRDLSNPEQGQLKVSHDVYFKIWALSRPRLNFDYLMLDEAQDTNKVMKKVFEDQKHAQLIMVGDRRQAIYSWRGASDAMQSFEGERHYLSQSFRFGPRIAEEANKWLSLLNMISDNESALKLRGFEMIDSKIEPLEENANAILCRTNAGIIDAFFRNTHKRVHVVGGMTQIRDLATAATQLKAGLKTSHPELCLFENWLAVCEYAETKDGMDLKPFVKVVNDYGTDAIIDLCDRAVNESDANLILSTAHKSKGREWKNVKMGNDFIQPCVSESNPYGLPSEEDAMLYYVSVTRAKNMLDNESLKWISNFF